jgi:uncharacterized repeat protein (TIGR03803 family)
MRRFCKFHEPLAACFITITLALVLAASASAAKAPKTLHDFYLRGTDGSSLYSSLSFDTAGNAYGTTVGGGAFNNGTVYKLSPTVSGPWKETILYSFKGGTRDGSGTHATPLFDGAGNIYGTTVSGGLTNSKSCGGGCGIVFKLSPPKNGGTAWTETILHKFTGGADGGVAFAGLIFDSEGNLYGATNAGGSKGAGTVFMLSPSGGVWRETVLYNFAGKPDGANPFATPIFDSAGSLYGTTYSGGTNNQGTVYKLTKGPSGTWTEQILCSFKGGSDGDQLFAGVVLDQAGNLYGATSGGGTQNVGTAFQLDASNGWSKTILHQFLGLSFGDAANPNGLVFDLRGNLYGTSLGGGQFNPGTIFKLTPGSRGWTETVLYSFTGGNDGAYPSAALTIDASGNLFGTTLWGGPAGDTVGGVAFEFIP